MAITNHRVIDPNIFFIYFKWQFDFGVYAWMYNCVYIIGTYRMGACAVTVVTHDVL